MSIKKTKAHFLEEHCSSEKTQQMGAIKLFFTLKKRDFAATV